MNYDYDFDDRYEPSLMDEIFTEASDKLFEALKITAKEQINEIIRENDRLKQAQQDVRTREINVTSKENELKRRKEELEREWKNRSLEELFEPLKETMWCIVSSYMREKPKCNLCSDDRKIEFVSTTTGRKTYETCECARSYYVYKPLEVSVYDLAKVSIYKNAMEKDLKFTVKFNKSKYDKNLEDSFFEDKTVYTGYKEGNKRHGSAYTTLEEAIKHCEQLNGDEVVNYSIAPPAPKDGW